MNIKDYDEIVARVSKEIADQFLKKEKEICKKALLIDSDISEITRKIGLDTVKIIYEEALKEHVEKKKTQGLAIKTNDPIEFNVIFGKIEIKSPYLWNKGEGYKPLIDEMSITHNGRSETVNRALSDFGSEESFGRAANRFREHYKYDIGSSAVYRVTKKIAQDSQEYVENKFAEANAKYGQPCDHLVEVDKMLIELDGCELRTAIIREKENTTETSPILNLPKKEKVINWKDVRIGFARPLDSVTKIYIGKKDLYPEVVGQLFGAAVLAGLTPETEVIGVGDGGNGLKEELENQFENMQFILDKQHLKDHFYDTAESLGIAKTDRKQWVISWVKRISNGSAGEVLNELEQLYRDTEIHRVKRLIGYITRFYEAINYNHFRKQGYPVGSGEVESAHKSIPQQRIKIPGACWHPDSINPMVALRILRADDWWEDFWNDRAENILAAA